MHEDPVKKGSFDETKVVEDAGAKSSSVQSKLTRGEGVDWVMVRRRSQQTGELDVSTIGILDRSIAIVCIVELLHSGSLVSWSCSYIIWEFSPMDLSTVVFGGLTSCPPNVVNFVVQ